MILQQCFLLFVALVFLSAGLDDNMVCVFTIDDNVVSFALFSCCCCCSCCFAAGVAVAVVVVAVVVVVVVVVVLLLLLLLLFCCCSVVVVAVVAVVAVNVNAVVIRSVCSAKLSLLIFEIDLL